MAFLLDKEYIDGYFMIMIEYPERWQDVLEVVDQGVSLECSSACRLLAYMYKDSSIDNIRIKEYLSLEQKDKKDFLLANTELNYEWNRDDLEENDFLQRVAEVDTLRKEKIGTYIDGDGEVKPLYGNILYKLYRKTRFTYADRVSQYPFIMIEQNTKTE